VIMPMLLAVHYRPPLYQAVLKVQLIHSIDLLIIVIIIN